jgi:hypothetical protein
MESRSIKIVTSAFFLALALLLERRIQRHNEQSTGKSEQCQRNSYIQIGRRSAREPECPHTYTEGPERHQT